MKERTFKVFESYEVNNFVNTVNEKVSELIKKEMEDIHPNQQWLVQGRITNKIFSSFYKPMMEKVEVLTK